MLRRLAPRVAVGRPPSAWPRPRPVQRWQSTDAGAAGAPRAPRLEPPRFTRGQKLMLLVGGCGVAALAGQLSGDSWFETDFVSELKRGVVVSQLLVYDASAIAEAAPKRLTLHVPNDAELSGDYELASGNAAAWPPTGTPAELERQGVTATILKGIAQNRPAEGLAPGLLGDVKDSDFDAPSQCAHLVYRKANNHPCLLKATLRLVPATPVRDVEAVGAIEDGTGRVLYRVAPAGSRTVLQRVVDDGKDDPRPKRVVLTAETVEVPEEVLDESMTPVMSRIAGKLTDEQLEAEYRRLPEPMRANIDAVDRRRSGKAAPGTPTGA